MNHPSPPPKETIDQGYQARWLSKAQKTAPLLVLLILFISVFTNLTRWPVIWYDEGSHLHVPKTLVLDGVYGEKSSEGFRYYGPAIGVGPTVMLPIAGAFSLFGIGLLQARLVMALYLISAVFVFFQMARSNFGARLAWIAVILLVTSRSVSLLEYGRQVLGEVPGLFFVLAGLWLWFQSWEKPDLGRMTAVGLLFGLATVTKNQYLLVLGPALLLAWFANLIYYHGVPQRSFLIPGAVMGTVYLAWQLILVMLLGPASVQENITTLRVATAGAAFVFLPDLMKRSIQELLSLKTYLGMLVPALLYGLGLALPRRKENLKWGVLMIIAAVNLVWYVVASVSWLRYAFPALAVSSLFVGRFFADLIELNFRKAWQALKNGSVEFHGQIRGFVFAAWLGVMVLIPLAQNLQDILFPPRNTPAEMAAYMNAHVPLDAEVETWEVEMGFLTDHRYHYPPQILLDTAVGYIWRNGPPPSTMYNYLETHFPKYVLVGAFSAWVQLYPPKVLAEHYELIHQAGAYQLYQLKNP